MSAPIVAITGLGGVFPGAPDLDRLWENLLAGRDAARQVPEGRWPLDPQSLYDPRPGAPDKLYSTRACFIENFQFNPEGLDLDPGFLAGLDPMNHLLLHAGRQALADTRTDELDRERVAVIIGNIALPTEMSTAFALNLLGPLFEEKVLGRVHGESWARVRSINRYVTCFPAGLLARALRLGGGAYTLDAACASSLYALSRAVDELIAHRVDAVLTGGLSRPDCLYTQMGFSQLRAMSASGRCAPFDVDGDGLVVGEGAGVLVLKRLDDALRQGDHIYALIRGIGLSNDTVGNLLAPDPEGQQRALAAAYRKAGLNPWDIDLIECHATGTPVGDKVEFGSLKTLWRDAPKDARPCVLGAVKANIGHMLTGAGAAGLIRTLLAMKHQTFPPVANHHAPRPDLGVEESPFRIPTQPAPWSEPASGRPRRAAINAFGFGGTNAHVILEEYDKTNDYKNKSRPVTVPDRIPTAIAVIAMEAAFGPWDDLDAFARRTLFKEDGPTPEPRTWRGAYDSAWFRENGPPESALTGLFRADPAVSPGRFRIPPKELEQMLPQQVLMLDVAARALGRAGFQPEQALRTAVFIGISLDLCTTNYHFRWSMENWARRWADALGLALDEDEMSAWIAELREAAGPPLTADRTLGGLGAITASRIAREFRIGGPSHSVSGEELSGFRALESACRALENGEVDLALAGAVDLAGDLRALVGHHEARPYSNSRNARPLDEQADGAAPGEGAAALVLKRLADAERDGDRIVAIVRGLGASGGDGPGDRPFPNADAWMRAARRAWDEAGLKESGPDLIEAASSGHPDEDAVEARALAMLPLRKDRPLFVSAPAARIGHTGAASSLAAVVRAALCLQNRVIPGLGPFEKSRIGHSPHGPVFSNQPMHWLRNRAWGPATAGVAAMSVDGGAAHVVLEEYPYSDDPIEAAVIPAPRPEALFVLEAGDAAGMREKIASLQTLVRARAGDDIDLLAMEWFQNNGLDPERKHGLAVVAANGDGLLDRLDGAANLVESGQGESACPPGVFFTDRPLGGAGEAAFVFPGAGNQFPGMGRQLALHWPLVFRRLEQGHARLFDQFQAGRYWLDRDADPEEAPRSVIIGQVAVGAAAADVVRGLGIRPKAALGYSLGESAALFAFGAWTDRDEMLDRMRRSPLFYSDLAGECRAAREAWGLTPDEAVNWRAGMVDAPPDRVREALDGLDRAYLLIVNTPEECVIGGRADQLETLARRLGVDFLPLEGVSTVHCPVAKRVAGPYRDMHVFETTAPEGVRFYGCAAGRSYAVDRESAADAILAQVQTTVDFPALVRRAYDDGVRLFWEMGPGGSCTRMIGKILEGRPHAVASACPGDRDTFGAVLRLVGRAVAHRADVDLTPLYGGPEPARPSKDGFRVIIPKDGPPFDPPTPPPPARPIRSIPDPVAVPAPATPASLEAAGGLGPVFERMSEALEERARAHEAYLRLDREIGRTFSEQLELQMRLIESAMTGGASLPAIQTQAAPAARDIAFDRDMCLEFAIGSIGKMLGPQYAEIDAFPTRVRLPDEPLMLVDRIVSIEGEPLSMTSGRVVTEHDVKPGAWYLDGDRIATCVAIEAGQADLFLSGYLGIDFETRGLAVYRLLDAEVTYHDDLPCPGKVISYDIRIEHFFKHGATYLFRFNFDATVDGRPLMTMRNGCAGFFSPAELEAGRGLVASDREAPEGPGRLPDDWAPLAPMAVESYDDGALDALRGGDLAACFGPAFENLPIENPYTLPTGRMTLIHRVTRLDPKGGPYGLGSIRAEADIHPDDWFLTCHFVDDQVMPGTLMYECCLHTLRVFLMRMGWIGEAGQVTAQPVPGVESRLKCRGQVIGTTRKAAYEVFIKELGYGPEPYAIADAIMYADDRPIVGIGDMCLRFTNLDRDKLARLWKGRAKADGPSGNVPDVFTRRHIEAFATGRPSDAFGESYRVFDQGRFVARLPAQPYSFIDRVHQITAVPMVMKAGGEVTAEYANPAGAWYFEQGRNGMPYAVLLEIALQPCGFLAAYMGSALTSRQALHFRNLGGRGEVLNTVDERTGPLTTRAKCTRVSHSGGMVIQNYEFEIRATGGPVYRGDTYFGFFTPDALANQVGLPDLKLAPEPDMDGIELSDRPPYPTGMMRMLDRVDRLDLDGGPRGLGFIRGSKVVRPDEWFFKAHFFQDPVWPGSLGIEALLQLLQRLAGEIWGESPETFWAAPAPGRKHEWVYRGQVVPSAHRVVVEAAVTSLNRQEKRISADGLLWVDGRVIYHMKNFTVEAGRR